MANSFLSADSILRAPLFWRLFATFGLLIATGTALSSFLVGRDIERTVQSNVERAAPAPADEDDNRSFSARRLIWTIGAITVGLALACSYLLARRVASPLRELTRSAEGIAAGDYAQRIYTQTDGEVAQLARAFNHMSERLETQFNQLDEDRQQLRTVLSSMVEGVVAIDADQRILFANERAGRLLEFHTQTAVGRHLWEVVRQRALHEMMRETLGPNLDYERRELNWATPDVRSLLVHIARLPGQWAHGALLVFHDNTELRRLERIRQEFIANVSHELKTPLAIIQATVETLIDGAVDDHEHRGTFLERIADQTHRLHELVLDMLRLARVESETEAFTRENLLLANVIEECLEKYRPLAAGKQQLLQSIALDGGAGPVSVWADQDAVYQILENLIDNALKYTPAGGTVSVRWGREDGQPFVEVKDTGIGIPEMELTRVFERFYRVDKARSRELGSTGLGLSIVKHLTQAMQGSIRAASEVGKGSTFIVLLPPGKAA